ncbi:hypothetical protein ABZ802_31130 [Streptomyces sp. NPDC047737]|uniref:hypothetical protein n=1 Tax=Streptomyces sp. NPDC047737 TaxID=3155740 RepID=UPI003410337F
MPSAAEPAHPEHTTTGPPGKLLAFGGRATRTGAGRRTPQPRPSEEPATADSPQQRLAETAEAWFLARGGTLTDERTAKVYRDTLDLVRLMHDGSLAEGLVGDVEYEHLSGMVEGLRGAPDSL